MSSSNNGSPDNNSRRNDSDGDSNNGGGSWGSTFMTVVGAVAATAVAGAVAATAVAGAVVATATVAGGLIALLSSAASAASSGLQVPIGAPRQNHTPLQGKWKKPEIGWLKLNVDGSRDHNEPSAGCGGVLRDSSGKWILGFSMKLDPIINESHKTELQAILTGLELAREMNVKKLAVESDSESAVSMVVAAAVSMVMENGLGSKFQRSEFDIVERVRKLLFDSEWEVKLVCVPRKANRVANWLAKDAHKLSFYNDLCKYHSAPRNCSHFLLEDTVGF